MSPELGVARPLAQGGVNPPVVPAGSGLAMAGPVKGVRCMWSQPSEACIIKLGAEGFYSVFQCII